MQPTIVARLTPAAAGPPTMKLESQMIVERDAVVTAVLSTLLEGLDRETTADIEAASHIRTCRRGEVLYSADGPPRVGVVASGLLRTVAPIPDGRRATIHYMQPGGVYGLPTLFFPVPLRVEVVRHATVVEIDPATIERVARKSAELAWLISRQLAGAVLRVPSVIEEFGFKTVRQRVARHLLALSIRNSRNGLLVTDITQQGLADNVGSAREVVSRCLRNLSDAGLVTIASASVTILDAEGLQLIGA
jgi:CRP/FNR family transcriptional regulator, cyclic AMP receptor protein